MAEFIFKKSDYTNADPEKDHRGVHKKGDFINWKPDGWSANWPNVGNYAEKFICIRCPEVTLAEAEAADHRKPWREDFDYEVVSTSQANVTLRVWNKNTSPTGRAAMTREKVEGFLTRWGCTNISFANQSVTFTFNLWNAVRSSEFWDIDLIGTKANFTLINYNATTRVGRIQVEVTDEMPKENSVVRAIESKGGTIVSNNYPQIVFDIERNDIVTRFRSDIKQKAEQVYKRHQYSIPAADIDAIIAAGGVVTMTRAELLGKLINHLEN